MLDMYKQKNDWDIPTTDFLKDDPFHGSSYPQADSSNFKLSLPELPQHYAYSVPPPPPLPQAPSLPTFPDDLDTLFMDTSALQNLDISLGHGGGDPHYDDGTNAPYMMSSPGQDPYVKKKFVKSHNKRQSGSAIFGFVGSGHNKKLSISGVPEVSASQTRYSHGRYGSYDYGAMEPHTSQSQQHPASSPVRRPNTEFQDDFIVTSNSPESYKFPRDPDPVSHYNAEYLKSLGKMLKQQDEGDLSLTEQFLDLHENSKLEDPFFDEDYKPQPPSKFYNDPPQPPKTPELRFDGIPQLEYTPKTHSERSNTQSPDRSPDRSPERSPEKTPRAQQNFELTTPARNPPTDTEGIVWTPVLVIKQNNKTDKIIKQQLSPIRRESTLKSTLPRGHLDQHFVGPDKDNKYKCTYNDCGKLFSRISNIRTHIQTHLCDRPFPCPECGKKFVRHHDLKRHRKGHEEFKYACPCGKLFPRPDALKRHRSRMICPGGLPDEHHKVSKRQAKSKQKSTLTQIQMDQIEQSINSALENNINNGKPTAATTTSTTSSSKREEDDTLESEDPDVSEFSFTAFNDFKASTEDFISV